MRASGRFGLPAAFLALAVVGALAAPPPATAAEEADALVSSIASELIKHRTRLSILRRDDVADAACGERRFVAAEVVASPVRTLIAPAVLETRWEEMWTLDRCGTAIRYRVFYTEVGEGGAYFAILDSD